MMIDIDDVDGWEKVDKLTPDFRHESTGISVTVVGSSPNYSVDMHCPYGTENVRRGMSEEEVKQFLERFHKFLEGTLGFDSDFEVAVHGVQGYEVYENGESSVFSNLGDLFDYVETVVETKIGIKDVDEVLE